MAHDKVDSIHVAATAEMLAGLEFCWTYLDGLNRSQLMWLRARIREAKGQPSLDEIMSGNFLTPRPQE